MTRLMLRIQVTIIVVFFSTPSFSSDTILWRESENSLIKIQDNNIDGKKLKNGDIAESELTENLTSQPVEIDEQDILKFLSPCPE